MPIQPEQHVEIESQMIDGSSGFPNNARLPLLLYRRVTRGEGDQAAGEFERCFEANGWRGAWRNGVFDYHHFHSNTHEVLGIAAGRARLQFGGPEGPAVEVRSGDMAVLPAGTGHKRLDASADFLVVGAYPAGQEDYDLLRGDPGEEESAKQRIAAVPLPEADPVYGARGPLLKRWHT